jgi:hypothetical protein
MLNSATESLSYFYNNLATLELRKNILLIEWKQAKSLEMILDCCFSMIQLISLEVLRLTTLMTNEFHWLTIHS